MKQEGRLKHQTVVSTVMSNLGFYKAVEGQGIRVSQQQWGTAML